MIPYAMKKHLQNLSFGLAIYFCSIATSLAQSTTITPGNNQPSLAATSTNNGIIVPQIVLTANANAASPVTSPAEGLLIYNTGNNMAKGFYYWTGTAWQLLGSGAVTPISIVSNSIRLNAGTAVGQLLSWNGNNWVNTNPKPPESVSNIQPYLAINFCISLYGVFPSQNDGQPYIGEIAQFGFNFAPSGWAFCNGQLLPISENEALFALIGTTYGGDGQTTYAVPDLRSRAPIHQGQGPGLSNYIIGETGGTETRTIDNKF